MCVPGTDASVERVFSYMNCLVTDEKNKLNIKTVKAIITMPKIGIKSFVSEHSHICSKVKIINLEFNFNYQPLCITNIL